MIYLDNAATTFPKPECVFRDLSFCLKYSCGNPGRSSHKLSLKASEEVYETRESVADFFNFPYPEHVVFTYNATYALNIAIKSFIREKCHIITSDYEHNSVIRPLETLKRRIGIEYSTIDTSMLQAELNSKLRPDTKGIIISLASNLTGDCVNLTEVYDFAKKNSLFLIVDASQVAGHSKIDLSKTPCDVLCAPGHKALFGIQGCGFAIFKDKYRKECLIDGGSGSESMDVNMPLLLPEGYEAGTLAVPSIRTLRSGITYINKIGIEHVEAKLNSLTEKTYDMLSDIKNLTIYKRGTGILAFNIGPLPSSYASALLDKSGICVRGGLHCAPSIHKKIGTINQGAIRVSFSYLNRFSHAERLYQAVKVIVENEK